MSVYVRVSMWVHVGERVSPTTPSADPKEVLKVALRECAASTNTHC